MKGNLQVLEKLNGLLVHELTAVDQYFIHSRMYEDWGFNKLYERINHEMQEELEHADVLIKRILFLEGTPDLSKRDGLKVGSAVPEMLEGDLQLEMTVDAALKDAMAFCESVEDFETRVELDKLLTDTESDHIYWLEQQLRLIKLTGLENYLQSQM